MPLIVDASVAVAWFVRNKATGYTDRIRRQARGERLHVPAVWPLEFTNALRQLERRKLMSDRQVNTIIDLAEPLDIAIARDRDLTAYDASYGARATEERVEELIRTLYSAT